MSTTAITASSVRLKLANDDTEAQNRGEKAFLHKEVTPSLLIYQGIEIEDQQCVFVPIRAVSLSRITS